MNKGPNNPWLLHFTDIDNIPGIADSGLWCDNKKPNSVINCGQPDIKDGRRERAVPLPPYGVVADYVPFYFAEQSPMLSSIYHKQVDGYRRDHTRLVYLVTRLQSITDAGRTWLATDRNARLATAKYTSNASDLADHIDWELINAQYWGNTPTDGSRVQRRMAELLVHEWVPWTSFTAIGVCCPGRKAEVEQLITSSPHRPPIIVRPSWYFWNRHPGCSCERARQMRGG